MNFKNRNISSKATMLDALKRMDNINKKLLIVNEGIFFVGLISIGDIQRALLKNIPMTTELIEIMRKEFVVGYENENEAQIRLKMLENRIELYPIVNKKGEILKIYFWEDLFEDQKPLKRGTFQLPVVVMAGGLGTRLRPLTNVLPKPLLPIGNKTMLEEIFDRFAQYGSEQFYVSVNYKAELIKYYIQSQSLPYYVDFFEEEKPMGTIGSLKLIQNRIKSTFFVTNCDILIEQDYSEILDYHIENQNEITIVAALKHYPIAYGTIETGENGKLISLTEKPELTFKINSGMYILEPGTMKEIPDGEFFHITQLIEKVMARNGKVGVFPVSEKSWRDIGDWTEYTRNWETNP